MPFEKEKSAKFYNIELVTSTMTFIEQFVDSVVAYTSRYNCIDSILYSPENIIGKPNNFPNAGDYPFTYMLKYFGRWWMDSESYQSQYMIQDADPFESIDYLIVSFEIPVLVETVSIYETYNPGAIVKIFGRHTGRWHLLWKGPPEKCIESSRKFTPPIRRIPELIDKIRIEFNQTLLDYHTALDAVLLTGYKPRTLIQRNMLEKGILESVLSKRAIENEQEVSEEIPNDTDNRFLTLPNEIILNIYQYLDLESLCRCARVEKRWYSLVQDNALYRELSLKRYWHRVDNNCLSSFMSRCTYLRKLDLSWCGDNATIHEDTFVEFLDTCGKNLTHLSLGYCKFLTTSCLQQIGKCLELTDLRLRRCNCSGGDYTYLFELRKLEALDLSYTNIIDMNLIGILKSNPHLKHLIIDYCWFTCFNDIVKAATCYNKELRTWSSWQSKNLSHTGVERFSLFPRLRELDIGWCMNLVEPADCLEQIACSCKDLRRLILSGWRGLSDHLLLPIIRSCKQLSHLDLLGIKNISGDICEIALSSLPKLRMLDISFCDLIRRDQVEKWKEEYPYVSIQRSCDTPNN